MPLLRFVVCFIKIVSWMFSKKDWKYINELDLKIIEGFKKTSFVIFAKSIQFASSQWQKGPKLVQVWLKSSWHL
jgi:hypothetical protein